MIRAKSTQYTIDGQPMPEPDQEAELSFSDLDASDSGRTEDGVMHRIVVREKVATFGFSYALLDREDYACLEELMRGKGEFAFGYTGSDGQAHTITAYCSKTSIVLKSRDGLYKNCKFNIIQC